MTSPAGPSLSPILASVDRAAFAVALAERLRSAGVPVGMTAVDVLVRALEASPPVSRTRLYWAARISLIRSRAELPIFDMLFPALFDDAVMGPSAYARRTQRPRPGAPDHAPGGVPAPASAPDDGQGLPWATLAKVTATSEDSTSPTLVPIRLPSHLAALADEPFERLDHAETQLLGGWLADLVRAWPTRPGRRWRPGPTGRRILLRATLSHARRTGWEPVKLVVGRCRPRPRRVVLLCDVSRSMQAQAGAYLHLMRGLALATEAETFAFATRLTRLTAVLRHRSTPVALDTAASAVTDRFGGTRIATNIEALLASRHSGSVRGAIVIIGSDGWDSDQPERLGRTMARLHRRAHRVIWMNPRAAAPGYRPATATMAAALPFCDRFMPAASFRELADVLAEVATISSRG